MNKLHFSDSYHRPYFMGIAILVIFFYHLWLFADSYDGINITPLYYFFAHGDFGVDVFFFLSTYGLSYSINKNTLKSFYKNRFIRIIPSYMVFLLICILLFLNDNIGQAAMYFFSAITGVASLNFWELQVDWYTPSLIVVYILFPVVNWLCKFINNVSISALAIALFFIVLHTMTFYFNFGVCNNFACRIAIILFGCTYFYIEKKEDTTNVQVLTILATFGLLLFAVNPYRITLAIPGMLVLGGMTKKLPLHSVISFLGKHSFEIYLAQVLATKYFIDWYKGSILIELSMVFIITIVFSTLFIYVSKYSEKKKGRIQRH